MNQHPIRFAIVGAGGIAQTHLQAFATSSLAQLVAVVDVRLEAAEAMAATQHCLAFQDLDSMLMSTKIGAAIVCTPPSTHPELCGRLAEAGVHVLCEKPIAVSSADALAMIEKAESHDTILTMASKFRYVSDMVFAKQLIVSGVLGEITNLENTFTGHVDMRRRWNSRPEISGGGVIMDNGTHSVDIVRYLLGPIETIQAIEGKRIQDLAVEDTARIHAKTADGVLAAMDLSWSFHKQTPWYVSVYGTNGTVLVGWGESKYRRDSDKDWNVFGKGYNKVQAFTEQINNFCHAIRGTESLLITSEDATASVAAVEAAYDSLRRDHWVSVARTSGPSLAVAS
ncbi:MAG: Gfo/Idh/MocA family oxidoreductase [Pirellulaceae bacterium]|nr:Gfo/Idh/MocA family oxidoreductase [Pirellulaceae bacterium]